MDWSGKATIGFNAGGEYYVNHPLSRQSFSNAVACLNGNSEWNNIVYDLTYPIQNDVGLVNQGPKSCKLNIIIVIDITSIYTYY